MKCIINPLINFIFETYVHSQVVASRQPRAITTWWQRRRWWLRIQIAIGGTMLLTCYAMSVTRAKLVFLRTFEGTGINSLFSMSLLSSSLSVSTVSAVVPSATPRGLRPTTLTVTIEWPKFDQDGTTIGMLFS